MQPILVVRETAPWSRWSVRAFCVCVLCRLSALCVCERVCELPSGAGTHSDSSSLGSPAPLRHPRVLRDAAALVPNAHQAELDVRACASVSVCRYSVSAGDKHLTSLPVFACHTSSLLPLSCRRAAPLPLLLLLLLRQRARSALVQTHLLLPAAALQPPRACLLLRLMNRRQPHWLFKRKGGSKEEGQGEDRARAHPGAESQRG